MASLPHPDERAPPLRLRLGEVAALGKLRWQNVVMPRMPAAAPALGHKVLVIPGFLSSDASTRLFRRRLEAAGYEAHGWEMGFNWGARADILDRLERRLDAIGAGPVTLIGWSLGGLFARELAKRVPERVARVVALGSPFSGDMRANNAWRLYELVNRHKVDAPPIDARPHEKPPVPTIALWSRADGIVAPACARGEPHEADRAIEVRCTHMGFMTAPCAVEAVLAVLGE